MCLFLRNNKLQISRKKKITCNIIKQCIFQDLPFSLPSHPLSLSNLIEHLLKLYQNLPIHVINKKMDSSRNFVKGY